ncbi:putative 2-aminoethylphosphonate ABC transporter permease subunit [Hydrogenophaga sp.]|uniref:putative 2-aminoethylphosphonate ABC transporter permease subunit n=1 Tax=Hydrogenophaga sp. TaxID=1904254 RepID=UPI002D1FBD04|nr:putative 2-aminoethylphosphonate ABC transporter permease subunit [Hydrogenophaga sp.]
MSEAVLAHEEGVAQMVRSGRRGGWGVALGTGGLLLLGLLFIVLPVGSLLLRSLVNAEGEWVGLAHYAAYWQTPALSDSIGRSIRLSALASLICVLLAYGYAYALTQSCMRHKGLFRAAALVPLLAPSLLMGISLIYLFGNQGLLKGWMAPFGGIYGEPGIVIGSVLWTFPHALLLLMTSLATQDGRLQEAARTLGASPVRVFWTVTLPASRYGLMMAFVVVFVLVITDFGVPKVIGGAANVLATDLYKQVVGQQNFSMGAVVGVWLLLPAVGAFALERHFRRRQAAALGARASLLQPQPHAWRDRLLWLYCAVVALCLLAVIGVAVFASMATFWPYNLSPSLRHYDFDNMDGGGWASYFNSIRMALGVAVVGTVCAFFSAWLVDKPRHHGPMRDALNLLLNLPLAIPGLVLGIGYIFFFNAPGNPLGGLYATMAILIICTVVHFYSVAHLTLLAAMRQTDAEFEVVSESLGVPMIKTLLRVHLPVCLPTLVQVAGFFFVNAMTTVSAVVFLYAPHTALASVAVLNMDDAGTVASAAAMAVLIFLTSAVVRGLMALFSHGLLVRTQRWRQR